MENALAGRIYSIERAGNPLHRSGFVTAASNTTAAGAALLGPDTVALGVRRGYYRSRVP